MSKRVLVIPGFLGSLKEFDFLKSSKINYTVFEYPNYHPSKIMSELLKVIESNEFDTLYAYSMGGRILLSLWDRIEKKSNIKRIVLESVGFSKLSEEEAHKRLELDRKRASWLQDNFEDFLENWYQLPLWQFSKSEYLKMVSLKKEQLKISEQREFWADIITRFSPGQFPSPKICFEEIFNSSEEMIYVAGLKDEKYCSLARSLSSQNQVKIISESGHNIHFQRPEEISNLLKS